MKFCKISVGVESGWWLLVDNLATFMDVVEWRHKVLAFGYKEIAPQLRNNRGHASSDSGVGFKTMLQVELERRNQPMSMVEAIGFLSDKITSTIEYFYIKDGGFYINSKGGVHPLKLSKHETITETKTRENFIFPSEEEIKIMKWPGGKHWYAKIGEQDVVVNGKQKWNTKKGAQDAVDSITEATRI